MREVFKAIFFIICLLFFFTDLRAQPTATGITGGVRDKQSGSPLPYAHIVLKSAADSAFVTGSISNEEGIFLLTKVPPGGYFLEASFIGYASQRVPLYVGKLSDYLMLPAIELEANPQSLKEVVIGANQDAVSNKMDKKTFSVSENLSQLGGSVLQAMQNLPGVTVQEGKILLRGSDKIAVLIDGKQTALTGMGGQTGLDNLPASAIEKIEIINNPSVRYDANGTSGIINIIYKKNKKEGFSGKFGFSPGLGALWIRKQNLPDIRPQYRLTPKINPTLLLNYSKNKLNLFFQGDYLYTETLNKNEFVVRTYDDGTVINQQTKRNRNTHFATAKTGFDLELNENNSLSASALFGLEKILDRGDEPFFNADVSARLRLWQFLEDEVKTTFMLGSSYQHKFKGMGHLLHAGVNYTFHREDEKYFFENHLPAYTGKDAFKLISDEHVADANLDYVRPLAFGKIESGIKFRYREIPTNMQFFPGLHSPVDSTAGGPATYKETIPAVYFNYVFENKKTEAELGLRMEYVNIMYEVGSNHPVYKSNGYHYTQPFPNLRLAYKINDNQRVTLFFNRRVDRPNEVDIRIFPKYDDAEIIKVGNPALRPQFTNTLELGYKANRNKGYFYAAVYHKKADGTITRIASTIPGSQLIYSVFQNAKTSYQTGVELVINQEVGQWYNMTLQLNGYKNTIDAFTVENKYPISSTFSGDKQELISGNVKWNSLLHLPEKTDMQITFIYLLPDIIPQGKINRRFSIDLGIKKTIQKGKGEVFLNVTDAANTMVIAKQIQGKSFHYSSSDYYETQVLRIGYNYKF